MHPAAALQQLSCSCQVLAEMAHSKVLHNNGFFNHSLEVGSIANLSEIELSDDATGSHLVIGHSVVDICLHIFIRPSFNVHSRCLEGVAFDVLRKDGRHQCHYQCPVEKSHRAVPLKVIIYFRDGNLYTRE